MARFPAGDARPGDLPGSVQQPIGKRREDERRRRRKGRKRTTTTTNDAPPRLASQKAAPLVVRVIDDRENMRARKKGPPLAASLLRGILSAWGPRDYHADCSGGCRWPSGAPILQILLSLRRISY